MSTDASAALRELEQHNVVPLWEFVKTHELPAEVRVVTGHQGKDDDDTVANGDILTLYDHSDYSYCMCDNRFGRKVSVPLTCPKRFVPLVINPNQPDSWERWLCTNPQLGFPQTLKSIVTGKLPVVVVLEADVKEDGRVDAEDALVVRKMETERVVIASVGMVHPEHPPKVEEMLAIPTEASVEVVGLDDLASASPYLEILAHRQLHDRLHEVKKIGSVETDARTQKSFDRKLSSSSNVVFEPFLASNPLHQDPTLLPVHHEACESGEEALLSASSSPSPGTPTTARQRLGSLGTELASRVRSLSISKKHTPAAVAAEFAGRDVTSLTVPEVADLLAKLKLGQHTSTFVGEQIDGAMLAMLDSETLEEDLHVSSKLHRVKILQTVEKIRDLSPTPQP
eukprot:m.136622 g.136622  ORF g.136622 m.136622 type:complete len:397 (-) comp16978_c0_seq7:56-1246(-)